ncbi:MAG TPA: ROK family transcriptional regulator [Streptosporangiaceae bacterium]|nr:ROK family transcriptional regulator [Streptosporangiaceae bacterium]
MPGRPGTPRLLREINDRAALELLLAEGPLTRTQLGERTGLSKVTASQMLARLEERGLVSVAGQQAAGRGPSAALYAVVPSSAYVAGLDVAPEAVTTGVADVTGRMLTEVTVDPNGSHHPVNLVHEAVATACQSAGVSQDQLRAFVIGTGGMVDPHTGDVHLHVDMPDWHEGVLGALRGDLRRPVSIENDVNLAAMAERAVGAARGVDNFVFVWMGVGLGLATVIGGRLHRGARGAAGEIGYLPVPGASLPEDLTHPSSGGFRSLVGARAVQALAAQYGFTGQTTGEAVRAGVSAAQAGEDNGLDFLSELATRVAVGLAAVAVTLDPSLMVLGGEVGQAGGTPLAQLVSAEVGRICPVTPSVVPTSVTNDPVLRGALLTAVDQARAELLASVANS